MDRHEKSAHIKGLATKIRAKTKNSKGDIDGRHQVEIAFLLLSLFEEFTLLYWRFSLYKLKHCLPILHHRTGKWHDFFEKLGKILAFLYHHIQLSFTVLPTTTLQSIQHWRSFVRQVGRNIWKFLLLQSKKFSCHIYHKFEQNLLFRTLYSQQGCSKRIFEICDWRNEQNEFQGNPSLVCEFDSPCSINFPKFNHPLL